MNSKKLKWIYLFILAIFWGSSFILIKQGLKSLGAIQLAALRIFFAATFLLIIGFKSLLQIPKRSYKYIVLTALFGTFIPAFLFSIAQTQISSSVTAILNSVTPMNTLVFGIFAFGSTFRKNQLIGLGIGFIGTLLLVLEGLIYHPSQNYSYAIFIVAGSCCYAINANLANKYLSDLRPLSITTGNFLVLLIPALVILCGSGFFEIGFSTDVQHSIYFILLLGVVSTAIANVIFFKTIQISSPVFAASVTYLIPIVAFCWGMIDNENLTFVQFLGAAVILFGVYLSTKK